MFDLPQTLIVVYKDELVLNLLKKLVDTNDDDGNTIVGTRDGSVNIMAWDEKMWLSQKKTGNITSKVLFLGDVKGSKSILPLIDEKYNKWGIKYGWAGKQAVLTVDESALNKREDYNAFLKEFQALALPGKEKSKDKPLPLKLAKKGGIAILFGLVGLGAAYAVDHFKDKAKTRQQMYLFGVTELYKNHLENFMQL